MTIGYLIKSKRTKLSISQKELAEKLNISIQRLNNFETGTRVPPLSMLDNLAKLLNFDINDFKKKYDDSLSFNLDLFKDKLASYRKDNNLTLNDLSEIINVSRQTLSKYEKGESYPNIDDYYNICKILNVLPSYFVYEKNENYQKKKVSPLIYLIPSFIILITLLLFIIKNSNNENEGSSLSTHYFSNESYDNSTYEEIEDVKIESFNVMSQSTLKLIKDSYSNYQSLSYNKNISRPYTININDNNISNINFYYTEWIFFPLYFDEEKFINHYIDENGNRFWGLEQMHFDKNLSLTPVYMTYEEYIDNLIFTIEDDKINIYHSGYSNLFIVPNEINGISNFVIKDFNTSNRIFIANESNVIFDGLKMDYIPNIYFINAKNIEFINQDINRSNIDLVAINQNYNYKKTTDFISTELISYLYINGNNSYTNFINFNDNIDILYLEKGASIDYLSFIKGNVKMVYVYANEESLLKFLNKSKKNRC